MSLLYIFVPLLLIGLLAFRHQPNILIWVTTVLAFGSVIAYLYATARWEVVSIYFRPVFPILFIVAAVLSFRRIKMPDKPIKKIALLMSVGVNIVLLIFFSGLNWFSFKGYLAPVNTIDIASPFHNGEQIVLHGGVSPFTNGHYHVRPQNFALDIVGLNALGMRSSSFNAGADLEDYVIFGTPVYSPVNGMVLIAVDEFDDQVPPNRDTKNLAGNHILLQSAGNEILLAHLKKGSIRVAAGDSVTTNSLLGQVGNTGNTTEPHLHIHIEQGGEPLTILNGTAVPFTINNHFLVRGDAIKYIE